MELKSVGDLNGSEDGLGVDLVLTAATFVQEDFLWMRVSAQQLQFARRHFGHPDEPLDRDLLLRAALWNGSRSKVSSL